MRISGTFDLRSYDFNTGELVLSRNVIKDGVLISSDELRATIPEFREQNFNANRKYRVTIEELEDE